jgi:hypothetical protein
MDNLTRKNDVPRCPDCGVEVPSAATVCWFCNRTLLSDAIAAAPRTDLNALPDSPTQPDLTPLALIATLALVLLGAAAVHPGLGIGLAVLALPAIIRTVILAIQRRKKNKPLSPAGQIGFFLICLSLAALVVAAIGVAAAAAFLAICASAMGHNDPTPALIAIGVAVVFVVGLVFAAYYWIVRYFKRTIK